MGRTLKGLLRYAALDHDRTKEWQEPSNMTAAHAFVRQCGALEPGRGSESADPARRRLERLQEEAHRAWSRAVMVETRTHLAARRLAAKERDALTGKALLIGAAIMQEMKTNPAFTALVEKVLDRRITRARDRQKLGLDRTHAQ